MNPNECMFKYITLAFISFHNHYVVKTRNLENLGFITLIDKSWVFENSSYCITADEMQELAIALKNLNSTQG